MSDLASKIAEALAADLDGDDIVFDGEEWGIDVDTLDETLLMFTCTDRREIGVRIRVEIVGDATFEREVQA